MSYFYSLRGWLEVEHDKFVHLVQIIESVQRAEPEGTKSSLYMKGWCWNEHSINWTKYIFYGSDVTNDGIDMVEQILIEITNRNLGVSGFFHAQGEDGCVNYLIKVSDDKIIKEKSTHILPI